MIDHGEDDDTHQNRRNHHDKVFPDWLFRDSLAAGLFLLAHHFPGRPKKYSIRRDRTRQISSRQTRQSGFIAFPHLPAQTHIPQATHHQM
jgi:hypothetical protein